VADEPKKAGCREEVGVRIFCSTVGECFGSCRRLPVEEEVEPDLIRFPTSMLKSSPVSIGRGS
jgi:hypothetical protein